MTKLPYLVFVLAGAVCAGQSVLNTPVNVGPSAPAFQQAPSPGVAPGFIDAPIPPGGSTLSGVAASLTAVGPGEAPAAEANPVRVVGPLMERSEFEQFAEDSAGRTLPVYGRELFGEVPTTFAPLEHVPVPADYVLGPGDELLIRAWGKIDLDSRVTVDRNGQIDLPRVGMLTVSGLRYEQVEGYLHAAVGALFKDFELNVVLGQLRSIQIFVLGNARRPGAYTVSSLSTLIDALFATGGPSASGTMRHIQLRRDGRILTEFDLYDLIGKGDKSRDARLLPGDVIYIPPLGAEVAIGGDVNQPGIYELSGETRIGEALEDAGGMTSLADGERVVLERIENHSSRELEEFALDAAGRNRLLRDGDLLRIFPLSPKFRNVVTLRGNVAQSGRYAWKEGMRVSDLIPSRGFLITRDYWNRQNHLVQSQPDHPFTGHPVDEFGNQAMDRSGDAEFRATSTIGQNSAEVNWDYALIERLDERDLSTRLIPFRLAAAIDDPASADNQILRSGDVITIFSRADLELPIEKHASFVRVDGEVNAPGVYRVRPGDTLRDVVQMAGGLTPHSYLYASVLTRVSVRKAQEEQIRQFAEQMQKELMARFTNAVPEIGQTGADRQAELALQQEGIARLASASPSGRVVLGMSPQSLTVADIPDLPLEDGDGFVIPPRLGTVQVIGAVYNANSFRFEPEKRLIAYLNDAGGATREADPKRTFVIRADGTVLSRQSHNGHSRGSYENLKMQPGDAIVIPEKLRVSSKMGDFLATTQFASQGAFTAAALSVIK